MRDLKGKFIKGHKGYSGEYNGTWKGDKAGYDAIHDWVKRYLGYPKKCEHCGTTDEKRKFEWASKSHTCKRDLKDWIRLCCSCHQKYDGSGFTRWVTMRESGFVRRPKSQKTHCVRGHILSNDTCYIRSGYPRSRYCRKCRIIRNSKYRDRLKKKFGHIMINRKVLNLNFNKKDLFTLQTGFKDKSEGAVKIG